MATQRARTTPVDLDAQLPALSQMVRERGALKYAEFTKLGVPKAQHEAAAQRLGDEGFEKTPKLVRVPLAQQLRFRLRERSQLPLKGLEKALAGCTSKEALIVAEELVRSGGAIRVLRTKALWIVSADAEVLSPEEIQILHDHLAKWVPQTQKIIRSKKAPMTFWRTDVRALVDDLVLLVSQRHSDTNSDPVDAQRLLQLVAENLEASVGLAFVPIVIEKLHLPLKRAHALLLEAARRNAVELRPDAGAARFTDIELRAAPEGPDGSRLLWVRLLKEIP